MTNDITNCDLALDLLQRRLDGDFALTTPEVDAHVANCASCRARFATAELFLHAYPPRPRVGFADRMTVAVRRDSRNREVTRWAAVSVAIAAAIVVAVRVAWPGAPTELPPVARVTFGPSVEDRIAQAKTTVVAWRDAATQKVKMPSDWPAMTPNKDLATAFEPAKATFADASKGLASGFEPVTDSAKRAMNLFRRDLPAGDGNQN
ncbi:MAG: zf-HC2 domain-containing protein [Gemmataceae bacterium]